MWAIMWLVFLILFGIVYFSYEYFEHKTGVPTFPSMPAVRRKVIELLQADAAAKGKEPYVVIDLGSGSGQLCWRIARAMPQAQVTGVELSYVPWARSVLRQRLWGPRNLSYVRVDMWPYDISQADAIVSYLPGSIMEKFGAKLRAELKPGALVIANTFPLRAGWEADETITVRVPFKTNLYIYRQR